MESDGENADSQNAELHQPNQLPGSVPQDMEDYDDENDKGEGDEDQSIGDGMGEDDQNEDILDEYGQEEDENAEEGQGIEDLNQEELEAIIESITSGKSQSFKKLQF